jgi:hypothetical protein
VREGVLEGVLEGMLEGVAPGAVLSPKQRVLEFASNLKAVLFVPRQVPTFNLKLYGLP